jgi:hypothetical protein
MQRVVYATLVAAVVIGSSSSPAAQWPKFQTPGVPRTASGEPDFNAPAPRTADGKPDLSGMWTSGRFGARTGLSPATSMYVEVGAPLTDYGEELMKRRQAANSIDNPRGHCRPMGIMQLHTQALPAKYLQTPRELVILYEGNMERREIFIDGRSLPDNDPQPWWNGYSVGRWDGDTLVAETTHFRDDGWLDMSGSPLTDVGKITERFRRLSYGQMQIDITIEDQKAYRRPFTVRVDHALVLDQDLIEFVCLENNRFPPDGRLR